MAVTVIIPLRYPINIRIDRICGEHMCTFYISDVPSEAWHSPIILPFPRSIQWTSFVAQLRSYLTTSTGKLQLMAHHQSNMNITKEYQIILRQNEWLIIQLLSGYFSQAELSKGHLSCSPPIQTVRIWVHWIPMLQVIRSHSGCARSTATRSLHLKVALVSVAALFQSTHSIHI